MELALTIIAGVGALLFLIGYLGFVVAGFKHHFVTGIISALPVLNIVTIPALWYKSAKKIMMSTLGIIIVAVSWFMGADKGINNTIEKLQGKAAQDTIAITNSAQTPLNINNSTSLPKTSLGTTSSSQSTLQSPYASKQRYINEGDVIPLPPKALYSMRFELIPLSNIGALNGRTIQIKMKAGSVYEGQVKAVSNSSIVIQSRNLIANELPIANIGQLLLMVKKAN